jgi:hypothetical protein
MELLVAAGWHMGKLDMFGESCPEAEACSPYLSIQHWWRVMGSPFYPRCTPLILAPAP